MLRLAMKLTALSAMRRHGCAFFFFSSRRRHTRCYPDWSSDVCSSDLERDETSSCLFNATPENHVNFEDTNPLKVSGDSENFSNFMRFLAPPAPVSSYVSSVVGNVRSEERRVGIELRSW